VSDIWLFCLDFQNGIFEILGSKLQASLCKYINRYAMSTTYTVYRFVREDVAHQLLDPFLISLRSSRVPPVQTVELQGHGLSGAKTYINSSTCLNTADIAFATFKELVIQVTNFLNTWNQLRWNRMTKGTTDTKGIQAPGATLATEAENAAKVIRKDRTSKPRAIDETRSLKDLLILILNLRCALRILQVNSFWGIRPGVTLIYLK
jgi:hypothetical protein